MQGIKEDDMVVQTPGGHRGRLAPGRAVIYRGQAHTQHRWARPERSRPTAMAPKKASRARGLPAMPREACQAARH